MESYRPLAGKVALITGAGRGFGLAIAERFAEAGADLALNYRASKDACDALAARVREQGQRAIALQADISDAPAVDAMVEQVIGEFGRVDVLVNNAGMMYLAPFVETDEAVWRAEMEVNVFGTMRVTRAVLPHMIAERSGKIVNLSSQLALIGWDRAAVYAGGKGFILTWSKSLAREVGRYNINVNVIGPGSIITDMNREVYPTPEAVERRAAELPLRRLGSPRDVAECALFLATDAGGFLTGQMLGPNGGNVM
jgi:NAD(P)-dependent dehydrogenase (short-subunit alcohol dehydrogenase family)